MLFGFKATQSLALVGMSNCGKTHLSRQIAKELGYTRIGIDDEIERALGAQLKSLGYSGIKDVAKWMGKPYDERYAENSALYLSYESQMMREALGRVRDGEKIVIDTTGSVIYIDKRTLQQFSASIHVLHLKVDERHTNALYEDFLSHDKPVIWGDETYRPMPDEDPRDALCRCYPGLLQSRLRRYNSLAHKEFPRELTRRPDFTVRQLVRYAVRPGV